MYILYHSVLFLCKESVILAFKTPLSIDTKNTKQFLALEQTKT